MDYRIAPARPFGRALTAATAVAGLLGAGLLAAPSANAQTPPAAAPAQACGSGSQSAPAPAAAQPAPAPAAPPQAAADQPQLMYSPWMKICGKGPDTNNQQVCVITQGRPSRNTACRSPSSNSIEPEGGAKVLRMRRAARHAARARHPHDHRPGPAGARSPTRSVSPVGCMADYPGTDDMIAPPEEGPDAAPCRRSTCSGQPISLPLPLNDFAKAYDGPATDPKVFEEQQHKLQEELQKRAEEARKKLEAQQPRRRLPRRWLRRNNRTSIRPAAKGAASAAPFFVARNQFN